MSLILVPYTNAMRLGQGFNSYTQQICVDDAVVINNERAENTLLNDGTTMRILIQSQGKPSAWTRQKEVVVDDRTVGLKKEPLQAPPEAILDEVRMIEAGETEQTAPEKDQNNPDKQASQGKTGGTEDSSFPAEAKVESTKETATDAPKLSDAAIADTKPASSDTVKTPSSKPSHSTKLDKPIIQPGTVSKQVTVIPQGKGVRPTELQRLQDSLAARKAAQIKAEEKEREAMLQAERERQAAQRKYREEIEKETRAEERARRQEDRAEQRKIREEKRKFEEERRSQMYKSIKDAASSKSNALSMREMRAMLQQNQFADQWTGMGENAQNWVFDATAPRGPSQTVTYTSRFVDRLSDITDDMCISGALSIKASKIGGSGRGSFIDSDKFKNSDLTFYISVKVINQTINFKDALEYKPIRGVNKDNFARIYGDSFISGFLEGGEFNAVVSMKILNKAKKTDIQAEAKVAFTAGPMSIEAEANVGIARENIESNTETTIQVSWCGGGHIKPMEQQWDLKSLMQAASRFPDLVADCPQRTYAILTKYDSLRSFIVRQPAAYSKLQYENAQIYTNVLMDTFMSYKALYKRLSDQILQVRHETMEVVPWDTKEAGDGTGSSALTETTSNTTRKCRFHGSPDDTFRFSATLSGLDEARKAIRRQMVRIVNEVDAIELDPKIATDEDHEEPFLSTTSFEARLPKVEVPERLRPKPMPLTGRRIVAKTQTEEERQRELEEEEKGPPIYAGPGPMEPEEATAFEKYAKLEPRIGEYFRATEAVDFLRSDWRIKTITFGVRAMIQWLAVEYNNGLTVRVGWPHESTYDTFQLGSFLPDERITSCMMETGVWSKSSRRAVLGVRLFTNHGRSLRAEATESIPNGPHSAMKNGSQYNDITVDTFDCPFQRGTLKGFFGRADDDRGVDRLGLIWGSVAVPATQAKPPAIDRRILPSKWGQTAGDNLEVHEARFGITYASVPKLLWALREVRGTKQSPKTLIWNEKGPPTVTKEGFTYNMTRLVEVEDLKFSWLTLPNNEVNFNTGTHCFKPDIEEEQIFEVKFSTPYKTVPATPAIWCVGLDCPKGKMGSPFADLEAHVMDLTTTGFKLKVQALVFGKNGGSVWGWCVWDKAYDNVKVKTGRTSFSHKGVQRPFLKHWKPDFGGKPPVSVMTGIVSLSIVALNEPQDDRFHAMSQWDGPLDSGGISFGVGSTALAHTMEVMYVAILEN